MNNRELKPCPFCGSEADIECQGKSAWAVECMNEHCGVFLPLDSWYISRENAIKAWNTRPSDNFKPCLCPKSEAKTVKLITSQIWQCPRCGGLGSISEPAVMVKEPQWPEKKELTVHGHQNCYECNKVGYNLAIDDCKQAWKDAQEK